MSEETKKMKPKRPTAAKRRIQDEKKKLVNKKIKSRINSATRSFDEGLKAKDTAGTEKNLSALFSLLDRAYKKGIYKLGKVSRLKSKYSARAK